MEVRHRQRFHCARAKARSGVDAARESYSSVSMGHGPLVRGVRDPSLVLISAGLILFLIGLLTGFAVPALAVPRLGLSAHLEGVLNGMFLMLLGAIWHRLNLSRGAGTLMFLAAFFGTFANWAATLLAAILPAARAMPIAGGGVTGTPFAEALVVTLLLALSAAMILVCVLALIGLRRAPPTKA